MQPAGALSHERALMSSTIYTTVERHPASGDGSRYSAIMVAGGRIIERMSFRTLAEAEQQADFRQCGIEYRPPSVPPARGGQDAIIARPGAEMHRDYSQPCDICGRRTSVRWHGKDGAAPYHRHRKCEERAIGLRRAAGGAPRAELDDDPQYYGPIAVHGGEIVYPDHPPVEPIDLRMDSIDDDDIPF